MPSSAGLPATNSIEIDLSRMHAHSPPLSADGFRPAGARRPAGRWRYGYELGREVGLKAGSLYPILIRLTRAGACSRLAGRSTPAESAGRPPRHLYRLTGAGRELASQLAAGARRAASPRRHARSARCGARHERRKLGLAGATSALVVRLLPASRSALGPRDAAPSWPRSSSPAERRRFALGCTRAALLPSATAHAAGRSLAAAAAAGLVLGGESSWPGAIGPLVPLVLVLALLAWLGRRPSYFGPVRADPATRAARSGGYALVRSVPVGPGRGRGRLRPPPARLAALGHVLRAAADARRGRLPGHDRAAARALGGTGLAAGCGRGARRRRGGIRGAAVRARSGTPLAHGLPGHGTWLALLVFGAPAAAALLTGRRTRQRGAGRHGGALRRRLGGAARRAARAERDRLPARTGCPTSSGPSCPPVRPRPSAQLENSIEASDPYFGLLLFGGIARGRAVGHGPAADARRDDGCAACSLAGLPAFALAASAGDFPGATALTTAALALVDRRRRDGAPGRPP